MDSSIVKIKEMLAGKDFWLKGLPLVLLCGFLFYAISDTNEWAQSYAGGADSSGYVHAGKLLLEGKLSREVRPIGDIPVDELHQLIYQPLGFSIQDGLETQHPTYPLGLPLLFAFFDIFLGSETAVHFTLLLIAGVTPLGVFLLGGALGLNTWWALASTISVCSSTVYIFQAHQPMTDVLSLTLAVYCLFFSLKMRPQGVTYPLALGLLFSLLVITRLPNLMFGLPILLALVFGAIPFRQYLIIFVAGIPGMVFLMSVNYILYGSPFTSGYHDIWSNFGWEYLYLTAGHYLQWLGLGLTPLLLLGSILTLTLVERHSVRVALLWTWAIPFLIFYAFYSFTHLNWTFTRFVLIVYPAIAIGGCYFLQFVTQWISRKMNWKPANMILAVGCSIFFLNWNEKQTEKVYVPYTAKDSVYVKYIEWAKQNVEKDAIIVCMEQSGSSYYYLDNSIVNWIWVSPEEWKQILQECSEGGYPIYAPLYEHEWDGEKVLSEKTPGVWTIVYDLGYFKVYKLDLDATLENLG